MSAIHAMPFGATPLPGGGALFRLWAPAAAAVGLEIDGATPLPMAPLEGGWHELRSDDARAGTRYRFILPDGLAVPDPASRSNPDGAHGASAVVDAAGHAWADGDWRGRPWHEAVVYELHVGTFTEAGTFAAATRHLPELVELGITAIELMPVAQFAGRRGWGYDGVLPFAPHAAYGTPDDLRSLVDAAHALGLMVLLDVVYNHFGPDGNYLHTYCPDFFNAARHTPWGAAIDFDGPHSAAVRAFFVHNALYWVEEFHVDGLRLDAVHAIHDDSPRHLCEEIALALREFGATAQPPRHVHLVLENDANAAWLLERDERGAPVAADAQWNDDLHHAAHVLATGETDGYYADYAGAPLANLGRALAEGFVYQGQRSALRGVPHGEPSALLPSVAFISFLQNHDQVGNRAFGERQAMLVQAPGAQRLEALRAALLLAPHVPLLFMGEEWDATTPFLYFCDFHGVLAEAVRDGRRREFARFAVFADEAARARIPDPNDAATFDACVLRRAERTDPLHAARLAATGELLRLRRERLVPHLERASLGGTFTATDGLLQVHWVLGDGTLWHLALNLGDTAAALPLAGELVHALRADESRIEPRGVRVDVETSGASPPPATRPASQAIVPRATYRLQFHAGFTFDDARAQLPYLQRLGVSHVYASPLLRARPGSTHGYDVVDCAQINPELGGAAGFVRFSDALRAHGLKLLLDIVPNHMGIGHDNAWWRNVLEHGEASVHATWFDIDWSRGGRLVLPALGGRLAAALAAGQLHIAAEGDGRFALHYFDHRFTLDPRSIAPLIADAAAHCAGAGGLALRGLATAFEALPPAAAAERGRRAPAAAALQASLCTLRRDSSAAREALAAATGRADAPDRLAALLDAQPWRLVSWRDASDEINYRRFFDINDLAALRMEEPAVFDATHALVLDLVAQGRVHGLRIDHPDGLRDPAGYFERLQSAVAGRVLVEDARGTALPLYVVAEKIEAEGEALPRWALHGTTGYRFANEVNGVLIDPAAHDRFDRLWRRYGAGERDFHAHARRGKREAIERAFRGELEALADALATIAQASRSTREFTRASLRDALVGIAMWLPVYRTYVVDGPSAQDERLLGLAVDEVARQRPRPDTELLAFVQRTLLARTTADADEALHDRVRSLAQRFQQFTAPVAAKGVEDTAFYRYHRFVPLDEVGGEPARFGVARSVFHAANAERAALWPHGLVATSTHDNKRSEDVRCRLDVLSERPAAWRLLLARLERAALAWQAEGHALPAPADRYLLLQTVLGVLPAGGVAEEDAPDLVERVAQYTVKAAREAKLHTSWTDPDPAYEDALTGFVARMMAAPLRAEWQRDAEALAWFGAFNSAALVALKLTAPGVPDLYQGNELIDLSLVDPDNRRPVDYVLRTRLLDELAGLADGPDWPAGLHALAQSPHDGRLKLWVTARLLRHRAAHERLLRDGGYGAIAATGERERHVVAFERTHADERLVTAIARWPARLTDGRQDAPVGESVWGDTRLSLRHLPQGCTLRNVLTGEWLTVDDGALPVARLFATLPLAVLEVRGR